MEETTLIRHKRKELDFTLDELSLLSSVRPEDLSRVERGFSCLSERQLKSVCDALGISLDAAQGVMRTAKAGFHGRQRVRTCPAVSSNAASAAETS